MAIETLTDLFVNNLLPDSRKLRPFIKQVRIFTLASEQAVLWMEVMWAVWVVQGSIDAS